MEQPHEMGRALGANHHAAQVAGVIPYQVGQEALVVVRPEVAEPAAPTGGHQEIAVEGHGPLRGGPVNQALELVSAASMHRGLDDEIEAAGTEPLERGGGGFERPVAVAEVVVAPRLERID